MTKKVKNFLWKLTQPKAIAALSLFVKLAVVRGVHHNDVLVEMMDNYNHHYLGEMAMHGTKLVDEPELLEELAGTPLEISHGTLMNWKRAGVFMDGDGKPRACWTNGFRVVYDLAETKKRIRRRIKSLEAK